MKAWSASDTINPNPELRETGMMNHVKCRIYEFHFRLLLLAPCHPRESGDPEIKAELWKRSD
jgi:hypothetical protein